MNNINGIQEIINQRARGRATEEVKNLIKSIKDSPIYQDLDSIKIQGRTGGDNNVSSISRD